MKTLIYPVQKLPHSFVHPLHHVALPLFFALAFLPVILRLVSFDIAVTNPLAVLGPVAAGFWLATTVREIRMGFMLLGALVTTLLWSVNWLMVAGHSCCSTMN